jgi:hypothetical protein
MVALSITVREVMGEALQGVGGAHSTAEGKGLCLLAGTLECHEEPHSLKGYEDMKRLEDIQNALY